MHRIRLVKFVTYQPLEYNFRKERAQPDEEIIFPQDDLYTILWETNLGEQLTTRDNETIPTSLPNADQPITADANSNDAHEDEAEYLITTDSANDINDLAQRQNGRMKSDVSNRNNASETARCKNSDWPNPAVSTKNRAKFSANLSERQEKDTNVSERHSTNENDAQNSPKEGDDVVVPEISQNDDRNESLSPREGKYNLRPNPNPNYSEDFRY